MFLYPIQDENIRLNIIPEYDRIDVKQGVILIRPGYEWFKQSQLKTLMISNSDGMILGELNADLQSRRTYLAAADLSSTKTGSLDQLTVYVSAPTQENPVYLDEIGLYNNKADINYHFDFLIGENARKAFLNTSKGIFIALFIFITIYTIQRNKAVGCDKKTLVLLIVYCTALMFYVQLVMLTKYHGANWARDVWLTVSGGALLEQKGSNLNYGLWMGERGAQPWSTYCGWTSFLA